MKRIKFKVLILLILVLSLNKYSLDIFADTPNENNSTILDGEIGEWDPELSDKPNFNEENLEVEGNRPQQNDYYTISVTVPLNMEFYVLPNSQLALGSFYSPIYRIKNNGSKDISVKLNSFEREDTIDTEAAPLYVEKINDQDDRIQIDLKMCAINKLDVWSKVSKEIDLTKIDQLEDSDKELYVLSANEVKGIKFDADRWELPQMETDKEKAMSNFRAGFVFSVVRPETENDSSAGTQN